MELRTKTKNGETEMEIYLNTPVKEVIARFPEVGRILEAYQIGCVSCSAGSCLLKEIIGVHNLSGEDEQVIMARIAGVIYPDRDVPIPETAATAAKKTKAFKYSPPVKQLVDEHVLIKKWIALIPEVLESLDIDSSDGRQLLLDGVDFIRSYADRFHHAKEEDILFGYFGETREILKAMLDDHEKGRAHARAVAEGVERRDKDQIAEHLQAYGELLSEHIRKEDEILYPWMDRELTVKQVGELFSKFAEVDRASGQEVTERCFRFVTRVEETLKERKEKTK
jgi:hemerythrin-like domain-containing protein